MIAASDARAGGRGVGGGSPGGPGLVCTGVSYGFDRHLRYDELVGWLHELAGASGGLVALETYGRSFEGRDLWLATVTDPSTGSHDTKPAHWVDASIHAVELTATVAACHLLHRLVEGFETDDTVTRALRTRTFYVVPRVNPDGAEWVLADSPRFRRSSTRPWPWTDGHRWPGHESADVDGDGRILEMRWNDPDGGWMPHPEDHRLLVPVPPEGTDAGTPRYRLMTEGDVADFDGFTIPTPPPVEGLDMNRNYPSGWGTGVPGSGDHPGSEPEIDALVRAFVARPNVCGFHAYHTFGGLLLRPSSTKSDSDLPAADVWRWTRLGEKATELSGYPVHSVYEDFTFDYTELMSGASDDWAYDHLGIFAWTTEFWDVVHAATGTKQSTRLWYTGPTDDEALAVLRWCDDHHPGGYVDWYPFEHPQLGTVELGGWDAMTTWVNPPADRLRAEVRAHADVAIHQALCAPELAIVHTRVVRLADDRWQLDVGVANRGWLPTDVSAHARAKSLVRALTIAVEGDVEVDGPGRRQLGQLDGRAVLPFRYGNDGTPDRALERFLLTGRAGAVVTVVAEHPRAGTDRTEIVLR